MEEAVPEAAAVAPPGERPPAGDKTLRVFRESVEGTLTQQDRILIVAQAIQMLDNFYVHRPLKEAIHAVRPIQRLRVFQRRLQQETAIPVGRQDELTFHNTLTQIFNSVRDLHTGYQLHAPTGTTSPISPSRWPLATWTTRDAIWSRAWCRATFAEPEFRPGAELVYWNGMAVERAIRANADGGGQQ